MKCEEFKKVWFEGKSLTEKEILHLKECEECRTLYNTEKSLRLLFEDLNKLQPDERVFRKIKRKILFHKVLSYAFIYYVFSSTLILSAFIFFIKNLNLQEKFLVLIDKILKFEPLFPFLMKFILIICVPIIISYSIVLLFIGFLSFRFLKKGSIPLLNL